MAKDPRVHPFFGTRSKLERARTRLAEFRVMLGEHSRIARIDWGHRQTQQGTELFVKMTEPLPPEMSLTAAEVAYHVRSALDQMLVAIALANGANNVENIHFPFMKTDAAFADKGPQKKMWGLPDDVKALIKDQAPWKENGNTDLWGLGDLANVDKHRYLIPFGRAGGLSAISCFTATGGITMLSTPGDLSKGVPFALLAPGGSLEPWPNFSLGIGAQIVFAESIEIFALKEAAPALENLVELGSGIVETFAAHCFGE